MTEVLQEVAWTQMLIQSQSVQQSIEKIQLILDSLGFKTQAMTFGGINNLYACSPGGADHAVAFCGHVDVVPVGDSTLWQAPPFAGMLKKEMIYGRGAVDMKGGISCFLSALQNLKKKADFFDFFKKKAIVLLITGDEEGDSSCGMIPLLQWLQKQKQVPIIDFVLLGEPTTRNFVGDHIKNGCKGSLNVSVIAEGRSGHVAYFEEGINPITSLIRYLNELKQHVFPMSETFGMTNLEVTSFEVGNEATNVIPSHAKAKFNLRFNDQQSSDSLVEWVQTTSKAYPEVAWAFVFDVAGQPFVSKESSELDLLKKACLEVTGKSPLVSALGANSDARFLKNFYPVAELGLPCGQAHKTDESVSFSDLRTLTKIYETFMAMFLKGSA